MANGSTNLADRVSKKFDKIVGIFSPKAMIKRAQFRAAYEALDKHRTRTKRTKSGGTGDTHLTGDNLYELREIQRDFMRNNPIVKGVLKTERDEVAGIGPRIEARTADPGWNTAAEQLWKEQMVETPCDVTGRFNINQIFRMAFLAYRRDGDTAIIFLDDKLQMIEGDQIGTPQGIGKAEYFDVTNGIAFDKKSLEVIGYYIGSPDKYGYIKASSYNKYLADRVHFIFNPERSSQSRGEPVLAASIKYIDYLDKYIDAEVVAAAVNACFCVFVKLKNPLGGMPSPYTKGSSSSGYDENNNRLEKLEPGIIQYGEDFEDVKGIGNVRPGEMFDPFVMKILSFIFRPLCIPLMAISLDYSGATFMNARIAYQQAQKFWKVEQSDTIAPLASRAWKWFIERKIAAGVLSGRDDAFKREIICNRWPYVDPYKEAMSNKLELENGTTSRTRICSAKGEEFEDIVEQREKEELLLKEKGLIAAAAGTNNTGVNNNG